jgi:hypothetical protein
LVVKDATGAGVANGSIVTEGGINMVDLIFSGAAPQTVLNRYAFQGMTGQWGEDDHMFVAPGTSAGYVVKIGRITTLHINMNDVTTHGLNVTTPMNYAAGPADPSDVPVPDGYRPAATISAMFLLTNRTTNAEKPGVINVTNAGVITIGPRNDAPGALDIAAFANTTVYTFAIDTTWLCAA